MTIGTPLATRDFQGFNYQQLLSPKQDSILCKLRPADITSPMIQAISTAPDRAQKRLLS